MEQEFLSIKDFAARAGVSAQAIYKRLNNPGDELINWLKADGKQKKLAAAALSLFQKKEEVIAIGSVALRFAAVGMMFMPFSVPVNMLYQSIQQPTISSVLSMIRSGAVTIPLLLTLVPMIGLTGIQIAQPTADIIAGLISIPFIVRFLRKKQVE